MQFICKYSLYIQKDSAQRVHILSNAIINFVFFFLRKRHFLTAICNLINLELNIVKSTVYYIFLNYYQVVVVSNPLLNF